MKKLTEEFGTATVKKGRRFNVELVSNLGGAGYLWNLKVKAGSASEIKPDFISAASNKLKKAKSDIGWKFFPSRMRFGGSYTDKTFYRAEETGTIEIEAQYKRPFEKTKPPRETRTFTITVK